MTELEELQAKAKARRARTDMSRDPISIRGEAIKDSIDDLSDPNLRLYEKQTLALNELIAHVESCKQKLNKANEERKNAKQPSYEPKE